MYRRGKSNVWQKQSIFHSSEMTRHPSVGYKICLAIIWPNECFHIGSFCNSWWVIAFFKVKIVYEELGKGCLISLSLGIAQVCVFDIKKKSPHCTNELTHHAGLFVALFREDLELDLLLQRLGKLKVLSNLLSELKSRVFWKNIGAA